jgi:hypothetical protein
MVVVRKYTGDADAAASLFQEEAAEMAARGYIPNSQLWIPGSHSSETVATAVLLCLIGIGLLLLLYLFLVKPAGILSVTYIRRGDESFNQPS